MTNVIALDVGTSSMRAVLYTERGEIIKVSGCEYHTEFPRPSYVEQDSKTWKESIFKTLSETAEFLNQKGLTVSAISVTSQRASVIPMSKTGEPLYNAIMWQDKRTIEVCRDLEAGCGLKNLHRKTGLRINPFFVLNKIIWLRENEPEIYNKAAKFIGVQDYVIYILTGKYMTDWTQASRTMLMDLEALTWDGDLMYLAGINADRLCELVPPGSIAGTLLDSVAEKCGLSEGIPIIVSGGDQQNAALALGVTRPGMAEANTGTGSFLISYAEKPVFDSECRVLCQAGAIAGSYVAETAIYNTGSIFRWFKEQFCPDYLHTANPYDRMCDEAEAARAGSGGIIMLPHFEGSAAPNWNPKAKGLFFNLGLAATRGMMLRSILEGISLEIAENLELMRTLIGEIREVHVAGGMTRSDLFCSIQASAYNAKVIRHKNTEASSLGACCNALVTLGVFDSAVSFFQSCNEENNAFLPEEDETGKYRLIMQKRKALYQALNCSSIYDLFM